MNMFNSIKISQPKKTKFDLGHERKLSLNMGKLVPIMLQDIVPGDSFRVKTEIFMRFAPMLAPIMHRVNVYTHYFFVPNRILWDEWEDFITGGPDGSAFPIFPQFKITGYPGPVPADQQFGNGTLADYLGLPTKPDATVPTQTPFVSALPFRAYQRIYDEYYRDQTLETEIGCKTNSGDQTLDTAEMAKLLQLRTRAWEKDYFTTALPWAQRGGEVNLPLNYMDVAEVKLANGTPAGTGALASSSTGNFQVAGNDAGLVNVTGGTINELRKAVRLQEWLEKTARGGARYVEQILSHFGVKSSDARLQRPEYLGGGRQVVKISEVLNTAGSDTLDLEPVGTMAGHGVSSGQTHGFSKTFEEHGYVIGIMSVLPKSAYQQGIAKHWNKFDKFDHYWPSFANLGEQEVKVKELYYDPLGTATEGEETFGYQSRYSEYKFAQDTVHGDFRESLAFWHMGRIFASKPLLNFDFIHADNVEMDRIFAVSDPNAHKLWCQIYNDISALRPMPYFGTPTL